MKSLLLKITLSFSLLLGAAAPQAFADDLFALLFSISSSCFAAGAVAEADSHHSCHHYHHSYYYKKEAQQALVDIQKYRDDGVISEALKTKISALGRSDDKSIKNMKEEKKISLIELVSQTILEDEEKN